MDALGRRNRGTRSERGVAMLGLLLTVIVLAIMVVIVLNTLGGSPASTGTTTSIPGVTVTTAPTTPESGAQEAAVSACEANYQAIETAIANYRALNGTAPAAGTAWVTSSSNGGPYLQAWPESAVYYSITWNGTQLSVVPAKGGASRGTDGTVSPKSGCFAA